MSEVIAGRVQLIEPIGEGAMGTVWRATDLRSGETVAAKVMRQSDAADLLRFVRESSLTVRGPHLLTPLGWVGEDGRVVFTMPICTGGSVADLVGDYGPLPPLLVAELVRQTAQALAVVHDAGLVHRDVKPANLLLEATGVGRPELLLADFGLVAPVDGPRLTRTSAVVGTTGYLAPESGLGAHPHPRWDLYAVGQVGWEMLLGVLPGDQAGGDSARDDETPAAAALRVLLGRLTAADPAHRPQSAREVLAALHTPVLAWQDGAMGHVEVLMHVDDSAPPAPGAADPGVRKPRRDRAVVGIAGVAVIALLVLLWSLWQIVG